MVFVFALTATQITQDLAGTEEKILTTKEWLVSRETVVYHFDGEVKC